MHSIPTSEHRFHIPVMGTGFTVNTPIEVAPWGVDSVVSLVDDEVLEHARCHYFSKEFGDGFVGIGAKEPRARQRRVTAYLDLAQDLVDARVDEIRASDASPGSLLSHYITLLPPSRAHELLLECRHSPDAAKLEQLRTLVLPGRIDANIMTKLDRATTPEGLARPPEENDAMAALLGFAESRARGAMIFSAGFNPRLFGLLAKHVAFSSTNPERKEIIIKVSDFRSAAVQARYLAKNGVVVDEFRIESPINCGGHAFVADGVLLGDILEEFRTQMPALGTELGARLQLPDSWPGPRITVQGGLGLPEEAELLARKFGIQKTGWGSVFLMVPEVVAVDETTLARLERATSANILLSQGSPLGVPFWQLTDSEGEERRRLRIAQDRAGSPCRLGHAALALDAEKRPICPSSRAFQKRALAALDDRNDLESERQRDLILAKSCICHDLSGSARRQFGVNGPSMTPLVCPGPNLAYFPARASFAEMVDHIYGRKSVAVDPSRPHMLLREALLYIELLDRAARPLEFPASHIIAIASPEKVRENVLRGLERYIAWNEPGLSEAASELHHALGSADDLKLRELTRPAARDRVGQTPAGEPHRIPYWI
jgi:hypothetical protein